MKLPKLCGDIFGKNNNSGGIGKKRGLFTSSTFFEGYTFVNIYIESTFQNTAADEAAFFNAEAGKPNWRRKSSKRLRSLKGMVSS